VPLRHRGFIELPAHEKPGGFDHAAVHAPTGRIYVAHTANDAVDVIDIVAQKYVGSIGNLPGVAGVLVAPGPDLIVTSNRGENMPTTAIRPNPGGGQGMSAYLDLKEGTTCQVILVDTRDGRGVQACDPPTSRDPAQT
jgi:hypothetical protein